jgi:hypothetical protein
MHVEQIVDEQHNKGRIGDSSRHILHWAVGTTVIGESSDDDNESRGTKN